VSHRNKHFRKCLGVILSRVDSVFTWGDDPEPRRENQIRDTHQLTVGKCPLWRSDQARETWTRPGVKVSRQRQFSNAVPNVESGTVKASCSDIRLTGSPLNRQYHQVPDPSPARQRLQESLLEAFQQSCDGDELMLSREYNNACVTAPAAHSMIQGRWM